MRICCESIPCTIEAKRDSCSREGAKAERKMADTLIFFVAADDERAAAEEMLEVNLLVDFFLAMVGLTLGGHGACGCEIVSRR